MDWTSGLEYTGLTIFVRDTGRLQNKNIKSAAVMEGDSESESVACTVSCLVIV